MNEFDDERVGGQVQKRDSFRAGSSLVALLKGRDEIDLVERNDDEREVSQGIAPNERVEVISISLDDIAPNPHQTREFEDEADLAELAASIAAKGIIQPVLVRENPAGEPRFELVAGERRFRAAKLAGLLEIPALIRDLDDRESVELSIIENAQREDLNPIEEALAYRILLDEFELNQSEIAQVIGKSRVAIANSLRLLQLDEGVIEMLRSGELSAGHGRALLRIKDPAVQLSLARRAARTGISVRTLEALTARYEQEGGENLEEDAPTEEEKQLERLATRVSSMLGLERVSLKLDAQGRKRLNLVFETEASWKRFIGRIRE